jgi:hypothetical protein
MGDFSISIASNIKQIQKSLSDLAYKQMPFATATALTSLAKLVKEEEVKNMAATFKNPSPFTLRSVRSTAARKGSLTATVYVADKAAEYLDPYEAGGLHKINSKAQLNPKDVGLNQYGQLPRGAIAKLKGRSDIFIGPVKTKRGVVNGVWQREAATAAVTSSRTGKTRISKRGVNQSGHLRLLVRFTDAQPVTQRLGYQLLGRRVVDANVNKEMGRAIAKAIATSK